MEINTDPYAHHPIPFSREVEFPQVIISYATKSRGGNGKEDMWAVANVLRENGITSFNGCQVKAGENWQEGWYGRMSKAQAAILLLSPEYFDSDSCVQECSAILKSGMKAFPVQYGMPDTKGDFLGDENDKVLTAGLIKQKLGNVYPPPDQGSFHDDFPSHAKRLMELVSEKLDV